MANNVSSVTLACSHLSFCPVLPNAMGSY
uniref:Uncharacterized protein n=1 Tax=Rhizophora mucronata TaxID=61149 RepID=A0A2P2M491_RHIMU